MWRGVACALRVRCECVCVCARVGASVTTLLRVWLRFCECDYAFASTRARLRVRARVCVRVCVCESMRAYFPYAFFVFFPNKYFMQHIDKQHNYNLISKFNKLLPTCKHRHHFSVPQTICVHSGTPHHKYTYTYVHIHTHTYTYVQTYTSHTQTCKVFGLWISAHTKETTFGKLHSFPWFINVSYFGIFSGVLRNN